MLTPELQAIYNASLKQPGETDTQWADRLEAMLMAVEYPVKYLGKYHHITAKRRPLNWFNRPWLSKIYEDNADRMVIVKAARLGISEYLYCRIMHAGINSLNGMDILPTEPIRNRAVKGRVERIIGFTRYYRENCGNPVDSASVKTIFNSIWNFVGSNSPETFHEFDADMLIYDEFDQCDKDNLEIAAQRTGAAERDRWIKVGNPTIAGVGIDAAFDESSKQFWLIACPHCNKEQVLDWWKNFIDRRDDGGYFLRCTSVENTGGDASALCQFCFKPIDRLMPGHWVAEYPDRPISGYHCDKLFGRPGNDTAVERPIIREMFEKWIKGQANQTALELFYNQELGLPYNAEGSHISLSMLAACARDYTMPEGGSNTVAGMDVGGVHHLHISQLVKDQNGRRVRQKVFIGQVPSWDEADRVCKLYGVAYGVVDAQGEIHAQREWCESHPGWYRCYYGAGRENVKEAETISHSEQTIRVNRTESLDASYADYANQLVHLPKNYLTLDSGDFTAQMTAAVRRIQETPQGVKRYVWNEGGKPDHHHHADNYERIAASLYVDPASLVTII